MARGFESKSVEQQQEAAQTVHSARRHPGERIDLERERRVAELNLQRNQVLNARTANPHRRTALQAALEDIERRLTELGVDLSAGS